MYRIITFCDVTFQILPLTISLGLSGLPLLVYARIFGFCDAGCGYFESKGGLARFLNVQERSVHRAIRDLLDRGLIEECGMHAPARGHATKRYRIVRERLPPGALATPDESSGFPARKGDEMTGFAARTPDEMTGKPLTICHPISKRDNKDFRR